MYSELTNVHANQIALCSLLGREYYSTIPPVCTFIPL